MKVFVAAFAAALLCAAPAFAQEAPAEAPAAAPVQDAKPISYFFGAFQGSTKVVSGAGAGTTDASGRMSRVVTAAAGTGFTITWSTLYIDDENPSDVKIKDSTEITFDATDSPTLFKQKGAPELFSGKPHYWARIEGNTLHVSALVLDADGTYDVTHYARTLDGDSMRLEFTRFKDGQLQREVSGTLTRSAE
jgi:hypothetical protein